MLRTITLLFLLTCSLAASAQMEWFRHLTTSDGLPENTGQAIIQDRDGFIWIGTQNGLARFDGLGFKVFQHQAGNPNSLSNNQVESLLQDSKGLIWIATRNGLNRFDPCQERFEQFFPDSVKAFDKNWFRYFILEDAAGNIWASTAYNCYQISDWTTRDIKVFPYPSPAGSGLALHSSGQTVFTACRDSLLEIVHGQIRFHSALPARVNCLHHSDWGLLAGTHDGVLVYIDNTWVRPAWAPDSDGLVLKIMEDRAGNLWVLTVSGMMRITRQGLRKDWQSRSDDPSGLSHNVCLEILEDRQGQIWIGTSQGINILDPRRDQFTRLTEKSAPQLPLPDHHVESIWFEDGRNLWIGTARGLVHHEFENTVILSRQISKPVKTRLYQVSTEPLIRNDNIDYLFRDKEGIMWVGCANGDLLSIAGNGQVQRFDPPQNFNQLRGIAPAEDGLWLGYSSGLRYFSKDSGDISKPQWLPDIRVVQFGLHKNELWVGTPQGIYVVNPALKKWRVITAGNGPEELPNTMLTHLYSNDTVLWISTFGGGLYRYSENTRRFRIYTESEGLPNNNIWAVYPDDSGNLWLSTDNGISCFNPEIQSFKNFHQNDGLNFDDFSMTAHGLTPSGEIMFGNPEGITIVNPARIKNLEYIPPVRFTGIEVNYQERKDLLSSITGPEQNLKLYPDDQTLTLEMAVLEYSAPRQNFYAFMLEGYDRDWVVRRADNRQITYTDLPTGDYTLKVKSANSENLWGEASINLGVTVIPPFYETWWFRSLMGMLVVLLIAMSIYFINRRRYLKRIRALEVQQQLHGERERISRDLHDHVGAHLTRIITDLDLLSLQLDTKPSEANQEQIESTRGFTQNTVRLLRDTIWAINQDEFDLPELANKMEDYLDQYLGDFVSWKVSRDINGTLRLSPNEVMNLLRIVQEATQNMLKYARASYYEIVVKYHDFLEIEISDDGVGFSEPVSKREHYGLKNMKDRAQEIGAKFQIHSTPNKGTIILITK